MDTYLLLSAVVTATALHRIMEPMNVLAKLERLDGALKTGKIADPQMKGIDTRAKAYAVSSAFIVVMSAIMYVVFGFLDLSPENSAVYAVIVSLIAWFLSTAKLDVYHVEIEKITQRVGK